MALAKVFQYGSNCDSQRLNAPDRLNGAAKVLGKAQTIEDYSLVFDKWSTENKWAASDLVRRGHGKAWGVLYDVDDDRIDGIDTPTRRTLAGIEGPSYEKKSIEVAFGEQTLIAVTFLVKPSRTQNDKATSAKYVRYIVEGLREHEVPEQYVLRVIDTAIANIKSVKGSRDGEIAAVERLRESSRR